jgi:hypothetical protein
MSCGIDFFTYGNCFIYIHFPIQKYLICTFCKHEEKVEYSKYQWSGLYFKLGCKKCGNISDRAKTRDVELHDINKIKLLRINPEYIDIEYNEFTGQRDYFLTLPTFFKNQISIGQRHVVETIPQEFIDSVRESKKLKLLPDSIYHLHRPYQSGYDLGWGRPIIEPVLSMNYQLQVLLKAQEAILNGYIIPLRVIFPQPPDANSPPSQTIGLQRFGSMMKGELEKHRLDPNHIILSPIPIGSQIVGAEGKSMTLYQELEAQANIICNGLGVPLELWKGGLSWTGSNISLKFLENKFLGYRTGLMSLCRDFILKKICTFLKKPIPEIEFAGFRMADDLQRSALLFQQFQAQTISGHSLLESQGLDYDKEVKLREKEMNSQLQSQRKLNIATANIQGQASLVQAEYAIQAQKRQMMAGIPGTPQQIEPVVAGLESPLKPGEMEVDKSQLAGQIAGQLDQADPLQAQQIQANLQTDPDLLRDVINNQLMNKGSKESPLNSLQQPMPENKPPRRQPGII